MNSWKFKFFKARHKDGREGICFLGQSIDHVSALKAINDFLGKPVLELNGNGIGVNLFLPEEKLEQWQKLALCDEAWDKSCDEDQSAAINMDYLRQHAKI